jgi:hypothetical protein
MYNLLNPQISPKILEEHHVDLKRWSLRLFPSNLTESEIIFYKNLKEWMDGFYQFEDKFVWRTSNGVDNHFADVQQMENELIEHENTVKEYITFFRKYKIIEEVKAFVLKCEEPIKVDFLMIIIDDFRRFLVDFSFDVDYKRFAEIGSFDTHGKNIVSYELNEMVRDLSGFVTKAIRDIEEVVTWYSEPKEPIEPIRLNYGENNDKIIKILHDEMNGNLIENIDFKDFERHFKENQYNLCKLIWKGSQPEIIRLFTGISASESNDKNDMFGLKITSKNQYKPIINHFTYFGKVVYDEFDLLRLGIKSKLEEKEFSETQLSKTRASETRLENTKKVSIILEKIRLS